MTSYYSSGLNAQRLKKCYNIAPPRVKQYLQAEIDFVLKKISRKDVILDLGCGYGRIIPSLVRRSKFVHGVDTSMKSLMFAKVFLKDINHFFLQNMDASRLGFSACTMDVVLCLQNGLSAMDADPRKVIKEAVRVTKTGGTVIFSSYSEKFWPHRLSWFKAQAKAGLIGELDEEKCINGNIVCRDGFSVSTITQKKFQELTRWIRKIKVTVKEVDDSCVLFIVKKLA